MQQCPLCRGGARCMGTAQQWPTKEPTQEPGKHNKNLAKLKVDCWLLTFNVLRLLQGVQSLALWWIRTRAVNRELYTIGHARPLVVPDIGRPCILRLLVVLDRPKLTD